MWSATGTARSCTGVCRISTSRSFSKMACVSRSRGPRRRSKHPLQVSTEGLHWSCMKVSAVCPTLYSSSLILDCCRLRPVANLFATRRQSCHSIQSRFVRKELRCTVANLFATRRQSCRSIQSRFVRKELRCTVANLFATRRQSCRSIQSRFVRKELRCTVANLFATRRQSCRSIQSRFVRKELRCTEYGSSNKCTGGGLSLSHGADSR